jgi:putative ABC transport system ATP-binding protein
MAEPIIRVQGLHKIFKTGGAEVHAVNDVTLDIFQGRLTAIVGRSGAGKTTLLNLISGLDVPTEGKVYIEGQDLFVLKESDRIKLRRDKIGFIFQNFGLLPLLSARENVGVPLRMQRVASSEREQRVMEALEWVGLAKRVQHRPYELSGGEQQRVAIARALAAHPDIILADEPTGQLDSHTGKRVLDTMRELASKLGITLVIVTHDPLVMNAADTVHEMSDGYLVNSHRTVPATMPR